MDMINKRDDSQELRIVDYYDRIHKRWIKVEVTKEVAKFMKTNNEITRKKQNKYNFHNIPLSHFESEDNDHSFDVIDENVNIEEQFEKEQMKKIENMKEDYERTLIENSLYILTPEQREVVEMVFYKNMTYGEISKVLNIDKSSVYARLKNAKRKIKNHIKNG